MPKTAYFAAAMLDHALRNVPFPSPEHVYLALHNVSPTALLPGEEVTGVNYARQLLVMGDRFGPPCAVANAMDVDFGIAGSGGWGDIVAWEILDASIGGYGLYYGVISPARRVNEGEPVRFPASMFVIQEL